MESQVLTQLQTEELDVENLKLPFVLKDKVLMTPGNWNENYYDSESVKRAFSKTDWSDKEVRAVFVDHDDRKVPSWVGFIENPKLKGDKVIGDLHIYDKDTAIKVGLAKMKCGISPKVQGDEDPKNKRMSEFQFLNFSIVTNPACKKAYINLIEKEVKNKNKMAEKDQDKPEALEESDQPAEETEKEMQAKKKKKPEEDEKEELAKKKKYPYPKEELSDSEFTDLLSSMSTDELSEYTDFVKSFLKKHKGASIKDAAKAYKGKKKQMAEIEGLSEDELLSEVERYMAVLKKKKYPYPEKEKEKKMEAELELLRGKMVELESKFNEPDKKTIKSLSGIRENKPVSATLSMLEFLKSNI